ncbi:hypothetical protein Rhe02_64880 [Rhizocola hellebori]|uniref:J domain-containing protein n=1 Tax=Rhizocola hellebori TaxID=1392758 RepID=A0A8J3QFQ1_9ACTN|nr:J domain-containing protein [Rhizocola hellebori]GIH08421.1 hypothetical protein Rhe02_64880 [Rhizocola hellebori]
MSLDSLLRDLAGANPYELLGLTTNATDTEIKEARRRLQRQAHPDLVDGDGEFARVINIAADLLLDPRRRAMFDSGADLPADLLYPGDPGTGKVQMPPPDEPIRPVATEPSFWDLRPRRPGTIAASMWFMYAAAATCALVFIIGALGTAMASDPGGRLNNVSEVLGLSALPIAAWIAITMVLGTGIRQGWRGVAGGGWGLTAMILLPIGLGCGTLMSYTLTPAVASTDDDKELLLRVPDLIQSMMVWAFPIGLVFAVIAMLLTHTQESRDYLTTMATIRDNADQAARYRGGRRRS